MTVFFFLAPKGQKKSWNDKNFRIGSKDGREWTGRDHETFDYGQKKGCNNNKSFRIGSKDGKDGTIRDEITIHWIMEGEKERKQ